MTSKTHNSAALAGLITAGWWGQINGLTVPNLIAALMANVIGSYLPDLDQASNRLWDLIPGGNLVGKGLKNLWLGHRTLSHSILGVVAVYYTAGWLIPKVINGQFLDGNLIIYSLMIGYISHLLMDGLTEEGLPLLFPLKWKFGFPPIKRVRIKTGGWFEKYMVFPLIWIYIGWFLIRMSS